MTSFTVTEDPGWIPEPGDKSGAAAAQRRRLIREYAARGHSSHQMAEALGILDSTVRRLARETGVVITADSILIRTRRPASASIVAETAGMLEALTMGLDMVRVGDLDPGEARQWAASLTASIRQLQRFVTAMKESAQPMKENATMKENGQ